MLLSLPGACMASPAPATNVVKFGSFELDLRSADLKRDGRRKRLQGQPAQLLVFLVNRPGELVTREQLRAQLWPEDTFVDFDHGLNNAVNRIRDVLGDSASSPRYIETVPRRGYRFIAEVVSEGPKLIAIASSPAPAVQPLWRRKRLVLTAALAALLIATLLARRSLLPSRSQIQSVAVLPFANLSGDPTQDYFADGMSDQLTTDLARVPSLRVISRTSTLQYHSTHKPLQQIARELGVDAVIEGSIARAGNRVRITAQLIDGRSDRHLWAESYDRDLSDALSVQNIVAIEVAQQVRARLAPQNRNSSSDASVNSAAYDTYLRGRYLLTQQSADSIQAGLTAFQRAVDLDPTYAPAYAGLADAWSLLANYGTATSQQTFPHAEAAARKALELDPSLAEAHASLGLALHQYDWDWPAAEREFKTAIQLSPSYSLAHLRYARFLGMMARHEEALREIRLAQSVDPNSVLVEFNTGQILYWARRYDEALEHFRHAFELAPERPYGHAMLAMAYQQKGLYADAEREYSASQALLGGNASMGIAQIRALTGHAAEAERMIPLLKRSDNSIDRFYVIAVYGALRRRDAAFAELEKACGRRDFFIPVTAVEPQFDSLRSDPRFAVLLRRLSLPETPLP